MSARPSGNRLILLSGGAAIKSYASAGQAVVLMAFVPVYGWFASRVDRIRLLLGVSLFFIVNLELFSLAGSAGSVRRHRVLHLGRHLQQRDDCPILVLRQRSLR